MFVCSWKPLEGQLTKFTNVMKGWQHRWFILDPESGMLEYFEVGMSEVATDIYVEKGV